MTFGEDLDLMDTYMILLRKVTIMLSQSHIRLNQKSCHFTTSNKSFTDFKDQENMNIGEALDLMDICMTL